MPVWYWTIAIGCSAALFFTMLGLPLARAVAPRGVAPLGLAPALGWAAYSVVALPVLSLIGFGAGNVRAFSVTCLVASLFGLLRGTGGTVRLPPWSVVLAAAASLIPTIAILPKYVDEGVLLGPPIFDHAKIAIVDAILRSGLPVTNPFYGPGGPGHLAYYYLWHFSVAAVASGLHAGSWETDAALTGFTAFASLMLMMAVALAISGRRAACGVVVLLSLPGSMRTLLAAWLGSDGGHRLILRQADLGGWVNQSAWVPQHLASACCVVLSALLMLRLAEGGSVVVAISLGLTVAAGFESSVWAGGIAFTLAGTATFLLMLWRVARNERPRFVLWVGAAALLATVLIAPFVAAELQAVAAREGDLPIALGPYPSLGKLFPADFRRVLELPAFWLVLLPFDLPAIAPLGMVGIWQARPWRTGSVPCHLAAVLSVVAFACLCAAWLFRSTIDNNDLGWRASLPAILLLTVFAACLLTHLAANSRWMAVAVTLAFAALGLPQMASMLSFYAFGQAQGDPGGFAASRILWQAVRRYTGPNDRIANNPLFLRSVTPWPANISWALLSDRPSCYAGWPTVIAYGALPWARLVDTSARFVRVFGGRARPGDVATLAHDDDCQVAVVTPSDGAWAHDPFAPSAEYQLSEAATDWRIYTRGPVRPGGHAAPP